MKFSIRITILSSLLVPHSLPEIHPYKERKKNGLMIILDAVQPMMRIFQMHGFVRGTLLSCLNIDFSYPEDNLFL